MKIFTALKIGTRLGLGFALVLAFVALISGIAIWELHAVAQEARQMMQEPLAKERHISEWSRVINVAVIRTSAIAKSSDPALVPFFAANAAETTKIAAELHKVIEPLMTSSEEKELFSRISKVRQDIWQVETRLESSKQRENPTRPMTLRKRFCSDFRKLHEAGG